MRSDRRRYIDWARAIAILIMIEAHTLDAWTRPADRHSGSFIDLTVLGGFAAPLFLWLAGIALVLSATRKEEQTGDRRAAAALVCRRGLEIFVLAFLFRLQAFVVSPGGPLVMLFRVDILNIMGPAIVAAGVVWGFTRGKATVAVYAAAATGVALVTPLVRTAGWVAGLPVWMQWYLRPSADYATFSLFPWTGFVLAGGAIGALIAAAAERRLEGRLHLACAAVGAGLIALGFWTASRPAIYAASSFWTSSPTFFSIRLGVMMLALSAGYAADSWWGGLSPTAWGWLGTLGRSSLFIYWIHVELVYGYATWTLRRRLSLGWWVVAYVAFCTAMYGAVILRDKVVRSWRLRRSSLPQTAAPGLPY